ncbi:glycoside hydrolase family 2 protein [Kutzneria sp. NPDC051319]|uniref:glycoside hydrolase family 2 protein n=1 Tax=Kutzneria sp. NPDC051319 TaxID=3155047 RepID=UPI003440A6D4
MRKPLSQGWTLRPASGGPVIDAAVPGCVHTDLLAAGRIPDPYLDGNEADLAWIGRTDWCYATVFDWEPDGHDHVDLVCEGLDTIATIELNGTIVGETHNMHRTYRFEVRELLRVGVNTLIVTFASALDHVEKARAELGDRPHVNRFPYNYLRKMACNFGWDWGPELVTAGIWRPIALESWSTARLAAVRPLASVQKAGVAVHLDVRRSGATVDDHLLVAVRVGDTVSQSTLPEGVHSTVVEVAVDNPRLWWPRGHGAQPLYPVRVELIGAQGVIDTWVGEIGFRTVEVRSEPDELGTSFTLVVNGKPIFARGVNWIPDDCFPHRVDEHRYRDRLTQACDAGVNLVRVWGGGIYESEDFYGLCDRMGLLVWQDFLFACAAYPEEQPLYDEVAAEAREAITRLCPHPSLAVWNGGNECASGYHNWGWQERLGELSWGLGYYLDLLPKLLSELDPTRPYTPHSPWSMSPDVDPDDPDHGSMHIWDVWNHRDYLAYREHIPRFAAEFGFQGPPRWSTLVRAVHDEPLTPRSPHMLAHQKAEDGAGKLEARLAEHFPPPLTVEDWHWATQLNQARALTVGIEHFRSWAPRCAGTIVWQLNDCWPVTSWAVIDGDGGRKPAWYALRNAYADRLLTVQPRGADLALVAVNDSDRDWTASVHVRRMSFDGDVLDDLLVDVDAAARQTVTTVLPAGLVDAQRPESELLVADAADVRATWFYRPDRLLSLPAPRFDVEAVPVPTGYLLTVTAETLLRDLAVLADRVAGDAEVSDMLTTLLPGEKTSFLVRTSAELDPARLLDPMVLRCANQLGQRQ